MPFQAVTRIPREVNKPLPGIPRTAPIASIGRGQPGEPQVARFVLAGRTTENFVGEQWLVLLKQWRGADRSRRRRLQLSCPRA